ncbi:MAG: 6-carboxytetrahydropterin synthase QueD [Betaproteobacteria bacterium]|nr:6-carboxytetrahydropterin synthase QueD [Betaproteobacteria bacterium]
MEIFQRFSLEAARRLPRLPPEHPCARMHGHSFQVEVRVAGALDERLGWVVDFAEIQQAWAPVHAALDHRCLNEVEGLSNPTSELLAIWIWQRLHPALPGLVAVTVMETANSGCEYRGDPSPKA